MKLNIYKNQTEIEKVYEIDAYDIMFGTVEDIFKIFDAVGDMNNNMDLYRAVAQNRDFVFKQVKQIFPEITTEEMRNVKIKEIVPFVMELFEFTKSQMGSRKNV